MTEQELREKITQILIEPDISCCDWELGKWQLQNWKARLPDQILALFKEFEAQQILLKQGWRKVNLLNQMEEAQDDGRGT